MKKCFEGEFLNNNSNSFSNESKITVVIPVYNCEKTIKAAVRSIQNQNMADIQIILVNDFSKDNTSKIIQELSEEDPRIRIINNGKNMGALYSRNIGILNAKGKYIMNLDNDDLFMDTDVFDVIYDEIEKTKFDIIGFRCVDAPSYNPIFTQIYEDYFHDHKIGLIVRQPELKYFPIERNNKFSPNDYHVWGRLVKTEVYQKAINNIGISAIGEDRKYNFADLLVSMKYWHIKKMLATVEYAKDVDFERILNSYNAETNALYENYEKKKAEFAALDKDLARINELLKATEAYERDKKCIDIVDEYIEQAKAYYATEIVKSASEIIKRINPRYLEILIDGGVYKARLFDKDFTKESVLAVQSLSKGEKTMVALALILSIRNIFMPKLPLIMDESFANLDANNIESIKTIIHEDTNQWIIVSHDERLI
jgi:glycosyltransferase involved in cell wall biosynthesis